MTAPITYDFKQGTLIIGPEILSGYSDGSGITFTPESEIFTSKVGIDGQTTRSRTNNDNYKCTVRLMQGSAAVQRLFALFQRNKALSGITYPFKYFNVSTGELFECSNAYLERYPDSEFAMEAGEREFTFYLPSCKVSSTEVLTSALGFLG